MFIHFIRVNKTPFMYTDCIWPFTTFILRNKHNKNIRLRLYWLRLYWLGLRCKLLIYERGSAHHYRLVTYFIFVMLFVIVQCEQTLREAARMRKTGRCYRNVYVLVSSFVVRYRTEISPPDHDWWQEQCPSVSVDSVNNFCAALINFNHPSILSNHKLTSILP